MDISDITALGRFGVVSSDGDAMGEVTALHLMNDAPRVIVAQVNLVESEEDSLIPLQDGQIKAGTVVVPYTSRQIRRAPTLTGDVATAAYHFYGDPETADILPPSTRIRPGSSEGTFEELPPIRIIKPGVLGDWEDSTPLTDRGRGRSGEHRNH